MRNIWVPREPPPGVDISLAEEHGRLLPPVFPRSVTPLDVARQEAIARDEVIPCATAEDLILLVGSQVSAAVLVTAFSLAFGGVRLLLWHHHDMRYRETFLGFYGKGGRT